ncbi:hypothetical protein [Lyngbya sp. CCY1209]|jgi:hypothetical protein|uniref:hypothetical protein n=1 Tax=Lyngbya sp. CCY1209 TaxID=2886103 RepID=UPI002D21039D|nr:hypothetical protein [Lyngbya sp. CCY1209]MEB3885734.1 hypothetical protein [Lyngbya sp. CCY1209]
MEITKGAAIRLICLFLLLAVFLIWGWNVAPPDRPEAAVRNAKILEAIYNLGNYIEAGIWGMFALGFAGAATRVTGKARSLRLIASLTFLLFGLSDIVEVQTRAWWHPWWLFAWKVLCGITMVVLLGIYWRDRR